MSRNGSAARHARLDMSHGFLNDIRKQLTAQAELNILSRTGSVEGGKKPGTDDGKRTKSKVEEGPRAGTNAEEGKQAVIPRSQVQSPVMTEKVTEKVDVDPVVAGCRKVKEMIDLADLPLYIPNAQSVLRTAITEPKGLSVTALGQVAKVLIERACEDFGYYDTAAILCSHIAQQEEEKQGLNTIPDIQFVRCVIEATKQRMSVAQQMRKMDVRLWINFCLFISELYFRMRVSGDRLLDLQVLLVKVLEQLSCPPSCEKEPEVNALAVIFRQCGQELKSSDPESFDNIICNLRDAYVAGQDKECCCIILMLIELAAGNWRLGEAAKEYYGLA